MQSVGNVLKTTLTAISSYQQNGENGQSQSLGSHQSKPMPHLNALQTTGEPVQELRALKPIGQPLGAIGAVEKPKTADEARRLAISLTTDLLPQCVQAFIAANETYNLTVASVGGMPPVPPKLTRADYETLTAAAQSLSNVLQPAHTRGGELEIEIGKLFAAFNIYTGDEGKLRAMVAVWAEELEDYPLYAIRKAYKWAVRGDNKLPTLASFIKDVKLAIGSGVYERRRIIEKLLYSAEVV